MRLLLAQHLVVPGTDSPGLTECLCPPPSVKPSFSSLWSNLFSYLCSFQFSSPSCVCPQMKSVLGQTPAAGENDFHPHLEVAPTASLSERRGWRSWNVSAAFTDCSYTEYTLVHTCTHRWRHVMQYSVRVYRSGFQAQAPRCRNRWVTAPPPTATAAASIHRSQNTCYWSVAEVAVGTHEPGTHCVLLRLNRQVECRITAYCIVVRLNDIWSLVSNSHFKIHLISY